MNKGEFVDALNEDLALEYRSMVQYVQHIATIKGASYQQALTGLESHLEQELSHARTLASQIDFLGGVPTSQVPDFKTQTEAPAALAADLELEERQLERYRDRVNQAESLGLPDVAEALAPLLHQTQHHVQELRAVLDRD